MTILCREVYVDCDRGAQFGDSGEPSEAHTDDLGKLFRCLRNEYGKASNCYLDFKDGRTIHCGWTFKKRCPYDDDHTKTYLREVWVHLYEECEIDDPKACTTTHRNGAITRHPFKTLDVADYRRRSKAAARENGKQV